MLGTNVSKSTHEELLSKVSSKARITVRFHGNRATAARSNCCYVCIAVVIPLMGRPAR